jgi:glycosyltransferase involved in cell wall biosynthesis
MKLLQVYNDYRSNCGGEKTVVHMIASLVEKHGGTARLVTRTSKGLDNSLPAKIRGFVGGTYNPRARREMARILDSERPDVVHVHNLYPLFSPSVLVACRRAGLPVVMTHHNYVLTCPTVGHLHKGRVCEKCQGGREHWCVLQNCRGNLAESAAYALRSAVARKLRFFHDNVTVHMVLSNFAKRRLVRAGFEESRIAVLPNMVEFTSEAVERTREAGSYVAYSGRMAAEKGVEVLLAAAAQLPEVAFRLAGDGPLLEALQRSAPPNVRFVNRLDRAEMTSFYRGARFLVTPSLWFEGCPLVVSEAMSHGLPVIASRIGGLPEFVDEGETGLLFEPGNSEELTQKIRLLWDNPQRCRQMGAAGREKAIREYGETIYYQRLMAIYDRASQLCGRPAVSQRKAVPHAVRSRTSRTAVGVGE